MTMPDRFNLAIACFDDANRQDPEHVTVGGVRYPGELLYSIRMTERLNRFEPGASEALQLAARAQHLCRWMIARTNYPMDRAGYHRWRNELAGFHAEKAGAILREAGYDDPTIQRVGALLRKERLKDDPETQCLEDVICLVFLEYEFSDFAKKHDEAKLINILRRTWRKMSVRGQQAAVALPLDAEAKRLVQRALVEGA